MPPLPPVRRRNQRLYSIASTQRRHSDLRDSKHPVYVAPQSASQHSTSVLKGS